MPPTTYLSVEQFAATAGLKAATLRNYRAAGLLPEPDAVIAQSPGWKATTVQKWLKQRGTARKGTAHVRQPHGRACAVCGESWPCRSSQGSS